MSGAANSAAPSPSPAATAPSRRIVAATYNIHSCVGTDRRYSPERVAAVLAELGADIVGLQEVDTRRTAGRGLDQGAFLAEELGFHIVAGPNIVEHRGCFGNALLSRWPIVDSQLIDLTALGREPRGAIAGDIRLPAGETASDASCSALRVVVTHLGLSGRERRYQAALLKPHIEASGACRRRLILMGDFNEWITWGPISRTLKRTMGCVTKVASFPSRWPLLPLDRICGDLIELAERPTRHVSATARVASDHLPVKAVFAVATDSR